MTKDRPHHIQPKSKIVKPILHPEFTILVEKAFYSLDDILNHWHNMYLKLTPMPHYL